MTRITKYRRFRKNIKYVVKKFVAGKTCPLGAEAIKGYWPAKEIYRRLNNKWQLFVDEKVEIRIAPFFTPDETGVTPYDQDRAMMFI